jgi:DNA repair exonuclease SbcCD ATPase subunit
MKLNFIRIQNFFSYEDVFIDFEKLGYLVKITGENGHGKSVLIEAIYWALTGKTVRKTNEIINNITNGDCKVTLKINDNVIVERTKEPKLIVTIDGEVLVGEGIATTQKELHKYLNFSPDLFLTSMVFGQSNDLNFLNASPEAKREIIQTFLDFSDIFKHRESLKDKKSILVNEQKTLTILLNDANSALKKSVDNINTNKASLKEAQNILSSEKQKFLEKYDKVQISELENKKALLDIEISDLKRRIEDLHGRFISLQKKSDDVDKSICEFCGNTPSKFEALKITSKTEMEAVSAYSIESTRKVNKLIEENDKIKIPITVKDIDVIEKIDYFKATLQTNEAYMKDFKLKVEDLTDKLIFVGKDIAMIRYWELALSEQGIGRYIINSILDYLNTRLDYYIGFVGGGFNMRFNSALEETITNQQGRVVMYKALSGGERKRVSLAITLALNDLLILTGKSVSNFVFFDEVADSLDTIGVRGLYNLLLEQTKKKRIFVITHNDYLSSLLDGNSSEIKVLKENGITKITT